MTEAADLYRQFAPAVLGYLRSQRAPDPEDLLGEVFLQVVRDLPRFKGDDAARRSWVFTVARHRLFDARRRASRRPAVATDVVPDVADRTPAESMDDALVAALDALTPEQREVVTLRFVADLPLESVAEITGRTVGAVKAMQHRALAQLGRILGTPTGAHEIDE